MQYARLGSSGLKVSRIALGMMSYGSQTERAWHLARMTPNRSCGVRSKPA